MRLGGGRGGQKGRGTMALISEKSKGACGRSGKYEGGERPKGKAHGGGGVGNRTGKRLNGGKGEEQKMACPM